MMVDVEASVIKEYIRTRNVKKVAKSLGITPVRVRKIIASRCGPLYGFPGLCRAYLYMLGRCYATAASMSRDLGVTYQDAYYVFKELEKRGVGLKVVRVGGGMYKRTYLVWDDGACVEELAARIKGRRRK